MARSAKEFTDAQKAKIFRRDRATCCFSGANLWILDSPFHGWESDWTDHELPTSRGGKSEIENGVCASFTFNFKKRNNSADKAYLFRNGIPTPLYYRLFGSPTPITNERLQRLSKLEEADWYFNRAITWTLHALDHLCWSSEWEELPVRDDKYWFKAAFKKMQAFQKNCQSIQKRGLLDNPSEIQIQLITLQESNSVEDFTNRALKLLPTYSTNSKIWDEYFHPENYEDDVARHDTWRREAFNKACKAEDNLDPRTFACIQADYNFRCLS
ncbi:MAG: HNH endonuclease [Luteolibacter sp.]